MDFTDEELRELSAFLARRLTPELQPVRTAEVLPSACDAWEKILMEARSAGRLSQVVSSAAKVLPRDAYLREASALLDPPTRAQSWLTGGVMVLAAAVLVCISLAGFATTGVLAAIEAAGPGTLAVVEEPLHREAVPAVEIVTPVAPVLQPTLQEEPEASVPEVDLQESPRETLQAEASSPADEPDLEVGASTVPAVAAAPLPEKPVAAPRSEDDDRICKTGGWVYTGTTAPSDLYVVPFAVHVRAAPPSKENGWNTHTPTRCWLRKGDVVRLAEPPLALPGGLYWIHVAPVEPEVAWADTGR